MFYYPKQKTNKTLLTIKNYFMFSIFKNIKYNVLKTENNLKHRI